MLITLSCYYVRYSSKQFQNMCQLDNVDSTYTVSTGHESEHVSSVPYKSTCNYFLPKYFS